MSKPPQLDLFGAAPKKAGKEPVGPAALSEEIRALGKALPPKLYLGTSSWSFPGWEGIVYDRKASHAELAREGLAAYGRHPLLRTVGIDRTYYAPIEKSVYAEYAGQVPADFRFLAKASEALTVARYPDHARYGSRRGQKNPDFLSLSYAEDYVVGPFMEGLREKAGVLLLQFAPQDVSAMGGAAGFADRIHELLARLPKGPVYAVEIRNKELLTPQYREALGAAGAVHCLNIHPAMPGISAQAEMALSEKAPALVCRWMLAPGLTYDTAKNRYEPFDELVDEAPQTRLDIAREVIRKLKAGTPAYVIANNKAEGSSPLTLIKLAGEVLREV
ncbi:MAG: DUF72 domain-containing protein [Chrysiogenetes bacterium]|nr:DUF72 domain-containing protein [Chrysiogenetes bacterium]